MKNTAAITTMTAPTTAPPMLVRTNAAVEKTVISPATAKPSVLK